MGEDFVKVVDTKNIQASQMMAVEVNDEKVCLSNVKGKHYAIGNVCTHILEQDIGERSYLPLVITHGLNRCPTITFSLISSTWLIDCICVYICCREASPQWLNKRHIQVCRVLPGTKH